MDDLLVACILAGGKGTRLQSVVSDRPKPMAPINGRPFLELIVEALVRQGVVNIMLLTGHLGEMIRDHFGNGERWGARISYSEERSPLGTGGAIVQGIEKLAVEYPGVENVMVLNGDTFFDVDIAEFRRFHDSNENLLSVAVKYQEDVSRYGSVVVRGGKILDFVEKGTCLGDGYVNGGCYLAKVHALMNLRIESPFSFEKEVLEKATDLFGGRVGALPFGNRFIDIGVPSDYALAIEHIESWLSEPKDKAVFLDRDGVVVEDTGYVHDEGHIELLPGVDAFLRELEDLGYKLIIVTNQAGIARGYYDEQAFYRYQEKLEHILQEHGITILDTFFCPYIENASVPRFRKESLLRKPNPGMVLEAAEKHGISIPASLMVGDKDSDVIDLPYLTTYLLRGKYPIETKVHVWDSFEGILRDIKSGLQ